MISRKERKKEGKVSFEELAQDFLRFYHERNRRSLNRAETSVKHLSTFFGGKRIAEITPESIEAYVTIRLQQHSRLGRPTRPATVNRELAALGKMFTLAIRNKKAEKNPMATVERLSPSRIQLAFATRCVLLRIEPPTSDGLGVALPL